MRRGICAAALGVLFLLTALPAAGEAAVLRRLTADEETLPPVTVEQDAPPLYFTAAEDSVLPLSDSTMPFWNGDYLYIPTSIFTDKMVQRKLNISRIEDPGKGIVILNSGWAALQFELGKQYAMDGENNTYSPGMIRQDGRDYVPAAVVARYFDLKYSVLEVDRGYLVWLRTKGFQVKDAAFVGAAAFQLNSVYEEYRREKQAAEPSPVPEPFSSPAPPTPKPPSVRRPSPAPNPSPAPELSPSPAPVPRTQFPVEPEASPVPEATPIPEEPEETITGGQDLYLCFRGDDGTEALLDTLDRYGIRAAVFCGMDFLEEQGGLLRRIAATGHSAALLADASDPRRSVLEQLEDGNRLLEQAACQKTRLALLLNGDETARLAARESGYLCLTPDRNGDRLRTAADAEELMWAVYRQGGTLSLWLDSAAAPDGLDAFLRAAAEVGNRCLPLLEPPLF